MASVWPRAWRSPRPQLLVQGAAWLTPAAVLVVGRRLPELQLHQLTAAIVGALAVLALSRRPGAVVCALVVGFPLAEIVLPLTLRARTPVALVRAAGSWKELLVAALVVAAVRHRRLRPTSPDRLDLLGGAFLVLVAVYYALPGWLASTDLLIPDQARAVAARTLALPVIALLAARHVELGESWRRRVGTAAVVGGAIVGVGAIVEIMSPSLWERFIHDLLDVNRYQRTIFSNEAARTFVFSDPTLSGEKARRAASILGSHLDAAFALLLPLGVVLHRLRHRWSTSMLLGAAVIGAGLALTQTRSALLGGVFIGMGALRSRTGDGSGRVRLAVWMVLTALVVMPLVADSALADRIRGAVTGEDQESTPEHTERTRAAFDAVVETPLGRGLGSTGGIARRFDVAGSLLPENHYLRVALDLGVVGGLLFVGIVVTAARHARRRSERSGSLLDGATASALAGLAVVGLFLDSFDVVTSAVPLLLAVGLATSEHRAEAPIAPPEARASVQA